MSAPEVEQTASGPHPAPRRSAVRVAVEPRWLVGLLVALLGVCLCLVAARWQWHRHVNRSAANHLTTANLARPPVRTRRITRQSCARAAAELYSRARRS